MEIFIYAMSAVIPYYVAFWFVIISPIIWFFFLVVSWNKSQLFLMKLDLNFAKYSSLDHLHLELMLSQMLLVLWLGIKTCGEIILQSYNKTLAFQQALVSCLGYSWGFFKSSPFHPKVRQGKASESHLDYRGGDVLSSWANVFIM